MATAGSLIVNIQRLYGDTDGDFITDTVGLDWLDQAQQRFCHEVMPLDEIKDYTVTTKVDKYDLPTNCIIPIWLMWRKGRFTKLHYQPPDIWANVIESHPNATGTPERYSVIRRQLNVGPQVPQSSSANTTASGDIDAASTGALSLAAASGTFRSKGFVKVGSEIVEYGAIASSTLTNTTRGVHGTTAATHASGATVTEIDLQMLYRRSPDALATSSTPDVPESFQPYLEKYALYLAFLARGDSEKAAAVYQEFREVERRAIKTVGRRAQDGLIRIQEKRLRAQWWS